MPHAPAIPPYPRREQRRNAYRLARKLRNTQQQLELMTVRQRRRRQGGGRRGYWAEPGETGPQGHCGGARARRCRVEDTGPGAGALSPRVCRE